MRKLVIIFSVLMGLGTIWFIGQVLHVKGIHDEDALRLVWAASLSYIQNQCEVPQRVEDLFAAGYLRRKGEFVEMLPKTDCSNVFPALGKDVQKVRIAFPSSLNQVEFKEGFWGNHIVDKNTQKEVSLVDISPTVLWFWEIRAMNVYFFELWIKTKSEIQEN